MTSKNQNEVSNLKVPHNAIYATGRRKSAIAKVWIFEGKGKFIVNSTNAEKYFNREAYMKMVLSPLKSLGIENKYDVKVSVLGGGIVGQIGACTLGVSRALLLLNSEFRKPLKENNLLTRDPRVKERKKYGRKKARKGFQFRKR